MKLCIGKLYSRAEVNGSFTAPNRPVFIRELRPGGQVLQEVMGPETHINFNLGEDDEPTMKPDDR